MSNTYHTGVNYVWSTPGILQIAEGLLNIILIVSSTVIDASFRANFLCGIAIFAVLSVIVLLGVNITGVPAKSDVPWFWIQFFCAVNLVLLYSISSTLVIIQLTKGSIITGILGYITLSVYVLDAIEKFNLARTPRSRIVWTVPNMPELT